SRYGQALWARQLQWSPCWRSSPSKAKAIPRGRNARASGLAMAPDRPARIPMPHHTPLIATIVAALVVAFAMGALAHRLRISPIAGYLVAGVLVGPFTPGFVAHQGLANELAEIGVILLM